MTENIILISILLLIIWIGITNFLVVRYVSRYRKLTKGIKKKELKNLLEQVNKTLKIQESEIDNLKEQLDKVSKDGEFHIQKVGFIRFNPFTDTGGNQSFCLALLDKKNNGIMISSLHSREQTRIYAKRIDNGKARGQELSKEEKQALKKAES